MKFANLDFKIIIAALNSLRDALPFTLEIDGKNVEVTDEMISEVDQIIEEIGVQ